MPNTRNNIDAYRLVSDAEVAELLDVSRSWVRKERFNRRRNHPHTFDLEPVLVGSLPRYPLGEVQAWIERRCRERRTRGNQP